MAIVSIEIIRTAAALILFLGAPLVAQNRLTVELEQYQHEADPVHKARNLAKLGGDQMDLAKKELKSGDSVASLHTIQLYRDEARETLAGLKGTGTNAEKKPAGFKELQISLREAIRHIDDLIFALPLDERASFHAVRDDLAKEQNDLIDVLFPRRADQNSKNSIP